MVLIQHILNETGISQIFKLIVPNGVHSGTYIIKTPDGWNEVDSIVNINDELFNVEDFIIGNNTKLKFTKFYDPIAFDLIENVYREQAGDGRIIFKWLAEKDGIEYDLLLENFELNLNKYSKQFEKTKFKIELELQKREDQNKLSAREDITIDLFGTKDLDENVISAVETFQIGYKKGNKYLSNFYTFDISQPTLGTFERKYKNIFMSFMKSDDFQLGENNNMFASYLNTAGPFPRTYQGPFIFSNTTLPNLKVEISNMNLYISKGPSSAANATLKAIFKVGETSVRTVILKSTDSNGIIKIDNEIFDIGDLKPGQNLSFEIITNEDVNIGYYVINNNTSIEISSNLESPLVKTKGVRLITALNQIVKNYTASGLSVVSNILGAGGKFHNTSISTGMYLRGLPDIYVSQKMKTSFKNLFYDGCAKLLALGYDVLGNNVVIEDIDYFFKEIKSYDLSEKQYINEGFKIEIDKDIIYNSMQFGSKKYSTNVKDDIKNFTTTSEFTTPVKSTKSKLDKETVLIIDEYKIQELIEDQTKSTNDNDDDLVIIDMVNATDYSDTGVFENCVHTNESGFLFLTCNITPFDTTLIQVGSSITIVEGLNVGTWTVLNIDLQKMKLNKTSGIQEGVVDTPIKYTIPSLIKNRTSDGFTNPQNIRNFETCTNIRHNPKYQMARWFPWFGSGLRRKTNSEIIKVTNYKNNSIAQMQINSADLSNELPGLVIVGENETLGRLRDYKPTFFNGEKIEISYHNVTFQEFFQIYNNWKFGAEGDRNLSRGFISCNTPEGIYDIYPFGQEAFSHNKAKNTLSIKGKVKGKSVDNPILLSVTQIDKNTVTLTWDYVVDYVNPIIKIQYSLDGANWDNIHTVTNVKTATFSDSVFNSILTGETVYFRIIANTADYYNKVSNSLAIEWQFNDWIIKEVSRIENVNCGFSYLTLEIKGTVNLNIKWNYEDIPGGGNYTAIDLADNSVISEFTSAYGLGETDENTTTHALTNQTKQFSITLKNSNKNSDEVVLNCSSGNQIAIVNAILAIEVKDLATNDVTTFNLSAETIKKYFQRPPNPTDPIETIP
ncbi:hypothetical protein [Chryseobacterium mucoviscidosis]|uniref:fibronectin type III domain-containing protein n=1 Tax=Chryseobacterium mucoviscidosis TaxID=1945581 RepID=UPI00301781CA